MRHPLGPFKVGIDYDVKTKFRMKYMLVGAFTWLKPEGGSTDPEDEVMQDAVEGLPVLEDEAVVDDVDHEGDLEAEGGPGGETVTLLVVLIFSSIRMEKDIHENQNIMEEIYVVEKDLGEDIQDDLIITDEIYVEKRETEESFETHLEMHHHLRRERTQRSTSIGYASLWRRRAQQRCFRRSTPCSSS